MTHGTSFTDGAQAIEAPLRIPHRGTGLIRARLRLLQGLRLWQAARLCQASLSGKGARFCARCLCGQRAAVDDEERLPLDHSLTFLHQYFFDQATDWCAKLNEFRRWLHDARATDPIAIG